MTNLIFIHGINSQTTGYSDIFYKNILRAYMKGLIKDGIEKESAENKAQELIQREILWANVTTDLTNQYLTWQLEISKRHSMWNFIPKAIDPLVIQILFYVKDKGDKDTGLMTILKAVDEAFKRACLNNPDNVVIIAHSLGSVIAYDYIFGFRKYKLDPAINVEALITLGSPIPIFTSAMGHVDNDIYLPANVKRWVNILDPDDGVARYCRRYFKNIKIEEREVNTGWNPLNSHANYLKNRTVARSIAEPY
jgi:hypothetical protein